MTPEQKNAVDVLMGQSERIGCEYIKRAVREFPELRTESQIAHMALQLACERIAILEAQATVGGFDRSATLARAVKRKAEEDADGHHAL